MARCCLLPKDSFHSIAPSIMALPQEEMVPQSQLVLCTAIEEIPRPSRHLSEPEDHLFNLPCSKQVSAIHRDALQEVNKAVCQVLARTIPCKRGFYKSKALDPAQRCEIGKCASEHGISHILAHQLINKRTKNRWSASLLPVQFHYWQFPHRIFFFLLI